MLSLRKPLLPEWRWWPAIPFAALIALAIYGVISPTPPIAISGYHPSRQDHKTDNPLSHFWDWITKDSISFFTVVLAFVALGQGILIRGQIKLGRDEFNATHRPRMLVQRVRITDFGSVTFDEDPAKLCVILVNAGESDAFVTEWRASLYIQKDCTPFNPIFPKTNFTVTRREFNFWFEPGQFEKADTTDKPLTEIAACREGKAVIYMIGYINYIGRDGIKRNTGFCRRYRTDTGQWVTEKDSEYEYAY